MDEFLAGVPAGERREAVLYAGGPASGKSTLRESQVAQGYVIVSPDLVRERLRAYRDTIEQGDPEAGALSHDEASEVAKLVADIAVAYGKPLVIDAVGANDEGQLVSTIYRLLELGYSVTLRYVTVPLEVAQEREKERVSETGRKVSPDVLIRAHREVSLGFMEIARIGGVRLEIYDGTSEPPTMVAEGAGDAQLGLDAVKVHDHEGYHSFLAKAKL